MEERETLEALISKGKHPAAQVLKARILLKADVSEAGEGWSDSRIVKALDTSEATVFRTRQRLVEEGFEGVLAANIPELGGNVWASTPEALLDQPLARAEHGCLAGIRAFTNAAVTPALTCPSETSAFSRIRAFST